MPECPSCGRGESDLEARVVEAVEHRTDAERELRRLRRENTMLRQQLDGQRAQSPLMEDAQRVFDHWCAVMGKKADTVFGPARQKSVIARLQEFQSKDVDGAARLCCAVDGLLKAGRWQLSTGERVAEKQPGAVRRDDLELICRTEAHVDRFAQMADDDTSTDSPPSLAVRLSRIDRTEALAWGFYRASHGTLENWTDDMRGLWLKVTLAALEFGRSYKRTETPVEGAVVQMPAAHPLELRNVLEAFAERGLDVTGQGAQFKGQCPLGDRHANGDRTPSVSVTEKADGRTLLNCFGCGAGHLELARALDLYRRANGHRVSAGQAELGVAA